MRQDISHILNTWKFIPDELSVRIILGDDQKEKIQIRLDLGLMQLEMDGRPDGKTPHNRESLFEYYKEKAEQADSETAKFSLSSDECSHLWQEAIQYYHRYLSFFQMEDFKRAERDTRRNLKLFNFVGNYACNEDDIQAFEQYRSYVVMMNTRAKALLQLKQKDYSEALKIIDKGIQTIQHWVEDNDTQGDSDPSDEITFLKQWAQTIRTTRPLTKRQRLEKALERAVSLQDFERAAQIRDELSNLTY
jgi:tetratricopeptide (TPR) repeat protein